MEEEEEMSEHEEDALSTELAPRSSHSHSRADHPAASTASASSSSAFHRAEALLNHSDGDEDDDDDDAPAADEGTIHSAALHDEPVAIEDGQMTEDYLEAEEGQGDAGSRGSTRASSTVVSSRRSTARTAAFAAKSGAGAGPQARSRMDRGAMRTWVQTHTTLKQRGELMEREHASWLTSKRAWFTPGSDEMAALDTLERDAHSSAQSLSRERSTMLSEIRRIHTLSRRFATYVSNPTASDEYIATLRSSMESIEDALGKFKAKQGEHWAALEMEVKDLEKECKAKEASYERWSEEDAATVPASANAAAHAGTGTTPLKTKPASKSSAVPGSSTDDSADAGLAAIRAELAAVEDEIAREGGATGGWDPRDHAHFLKLYTQLAGTGAGVGAGAAGADTADTDSNSGPGLAPEIESQLCARIALEIAHQTASSALLHLEWHARYQSLLARKKTLIARWKQAKARGRRDATEMAEEMAAKAEAEAEQARLEAAAQAAERAAKAEQIAAWKADKARRDSARAARENAEAELRDRQARQRAEEERRRLRSAVEAAAEERAAEAMVAAIQAAPSAREIAQAERAEREATRRLREKQEALLAEVAAKRAAKEREAARAEQRRAQMAAAAAPALASQRDPSRLVRPTSAMVERARQREAEEAEIAEYQRTHGGKTPTTMLSRPVLGMKATAGWRQGL